MKKSPFKFTSSNYWQEIEDLIDDKKIPAELGVYLKRLIVSHFAKTVPPEANSQIIASAKEFLQNGIELSDSAGEILYDTMVFVPDNENSKCFFRLMPKYAGGHFKYLKDV